jgi:glycosyltransferase involved in cell wall biosynthesis
VTSFPEVVGDAGILVNPTDVEAIANAIQQLQTDSSCSERLIKKGIERAEQFTWKKTGERIAEIYEKLLGQPS